MLASFFFGGWQGAGPCGMYVFAYDINKKGVSLQANMANKNNNELEKRNQAFLIYQDENGIARVNVRFESEQDPNRTHKKFLLVRQEGNRSGCQWMSGDSPLTGYDKEGNV